MPPDIRYMETYPLGDPTIILTREELATLIDRILDRHSQEDTK